MRSQKTNEIAARDLLISARRFYNREKNKKKPGGRDKAVKTGRIDRSVSDCFSQAEYL